MSATGLRMWTKSRCSSNLTVLSLKRRNPPSSWCWLKRTYATQHNMDFGNTQSQLLNESANARRRAEPKHDTAGPFQLGLSQSALRQGEKVPKWSELSTGGKVMRSTARTTNMGVILLGAGLSALLVYSLTSELFSKNSPTVLYGDACEKIKKSHRIAKYLNAPLTFHNNAPSAVRPRHRNRHVTSRVMVDRYGQEHMIMTFYVQGRPEGEAPSEASYLEAVSSWIDEKAAVLPDLSFDDTVEWSKERGTMLWDKSVRAFRYISGAPLPPTPPLPSLPPSEEGATVNQKKSSVWNLVGIFSSIRTTKDTTQDIKSPLTGRHYTEGEVHADLVKNKDGYFVFRYLLVDIPSRVPLNLFETISNHLLASGSRDRNPVRVFVERDSSVRETEPVMRWISS